MVIASELLIRTECRLLHFSLSIYHKLVYQRSFFNRFRPFILPGTPIQHAYAALETKPIIPIRSSTFVSKVCLIRHDIQDIRVWLNSKQFQSTHRSHQNTQTLYRAKVEQSMALIMSEARRMYIRRAVPNVLKS
ncbi:unnamed protein product [Albugo candida]|uniref:Uncharacterized protein n=1 Tax=Albugo candida TaxID=65357 RepID=A0A024FTB7_9STRA|nr:unnamed protein product [Albugo candida]|eukprot:CCI10251.1 unnamed protein product [Albugo candida]